jgi:hypothetical protein
MSKVYVLTANYRNTDSPIVFPEVFDSAEGGKEYAKENWGVSLVKLSPSLWQASGDGFTIRLHKRTVFKR